MNVAILIPAFQPSDALVTLVQQLARSGYAAIVIVDDGSGPASRPIFDSIAPLAIILRHAANLGKGAALKMGMNQILCEFPHLTGIVTADADGQHSAADIFRIAQALVRNPRSLVLGARQFTGRDIPLRSRFGNRLTIAAVRLLIGQSLSDTQTGLRGLPLPFLYHLLPIPSTGYEFELDMLIACKHHSWPISQIAIETIYEPGNSSSHFNPLQDSLRIYFTLLRFGFVSLLTAVVDNSVFLLLYPALGSIGKTQILSRTVAVAFNYIAARKAVFLSQERHAVTFPRYLLLVTVSGLISWGLIQLLITYTALSPIAAKLAAEATLFIANFAIQRDFVFRKRRDADTDSTATDWDRYYRQVPATAHLTRKYTAHTITTALQQHAAPHPTIVEFGGANSCFYDRLVHDLQPTAYHVIDLNQHGLDLLAARATGALTLHRKDCLDLPALPPLQADIVYSVGLIEHFDPANTRRAIEGHLQLLKPGGLLLITFPTPTWLYRIARTTVSALGQWKFPDERPLKPAEVHSTLRQHNAEILFEKTLWPLVFTQHLILIRLRGVA